LSAGARAAAATSPVGAAPGPSRRQAFRRRLCRPDRSSAPAAGRTRNARAACVRPARGCGSSSPATVPSSPRGRRAWCGALQQSHRRHPRRRPALVMRRRASSAGASRCAPNSLVASLRSSLVDAIAGTPPALIVPTRCPTRSAALPCL
jgi:hypothetical protein